jgi:hypothetical protein
MEIPPFNHGGWRDIYRNGIQPSMLLSELVAAMTSAIVTSANQFLRKYLQLQDAL